MGKRISSGGALGKNPFKGIVEIAEDANPCFTQGVHDGVKAAPDEYKACMDYMNH